MANRNNLVRVNYPFVTTTGNLPFQAVPCQARLEAAAKIKHYSLSLNCFLLVGGGKIILLPPPKFKRHIQMLNIVLSTVDTS